MKDAYGLLAYVDFIALIPTLSAIFWEPSHFFRRVYLLTEKRRAGARNPWMKTPVQLASTVATLIWATNWIAVYVPPREQRVFIVGLAVFLPVWMPLLCAVLIVLSWLTYRATLGGGVGLLLFAWNSHAVKVKRLMFVERWVAYLRVPLSLEIYKAADLRKLRWCALYFFGSDLVSPVYRHFPFDRFLYGVISAD